MGHDLRLSVDVACGAALVAQGRVVHLNAFPSDASSNAVGLFPFALGTDEMAKKTSEALSRLQRAASCNFHGTLMTTVPSEYEY